MSPRNDYCVICGCLLAVHSDLFPSWCKQVRGIYKTDEQPPQITGVGRCTTHVVPFELPVADTYRFFRISTAISEHACFPFHDACYKIFREALDSAPSEEDIKAFHGILTSIRYRRPSLRWGHLYDGAQSLQHTVRRQNPDCDLLCNPIDPILLDTRLDDDLTYGSNEEHLSIKQEGGLSRKAAVVHRVDPFARLPLEIVILVLSNMSLSDVCNLRVSSRAVAVIHFPSQFWQSRFWPQHECGYFGPLVQKLAQRSANYQRIYRFLQRQIKDQGYLSSVLRNRRRIWGLALGIADLVRTVRFSSLAGCLSIPKGLVVRPNGITCVLPERSEDDGCQELQQVYATFPDELLENFHTLGVSFVLVAGKTFVSGLRFFFADRSVEVGYVHREEFMLRVPPDICEPFRGLQIMSNGQGIRAVALDVEPLVWAGEPDCNTCTRCRLRSEQLRGFRVGVDAMRITSVVIVDGRNTDVPPDTLIWSPTFPPGELDFHADKYQLPELYKQVHSPTTFIVFREMPLHCITAYVVGPYIGMTGIRLTYESGESMLWGSDYGAALSFFLNATQKEHLTKLVVQAGKHIIVGLQIVTSLRRECTFMWQNTTDNVRSSTLEPSTSASSIVGFYGCFVTPPYNSLASLGIFSSHRYSPDGHGEVRRLEASRCTFNTGPTNSGDPGLAWNIHGHFETGLVVDERRFRSVCAYFCPPEHRNRKCGDTTGLLFDRAESSYPVLLGQWIGGRESDKIWFNPEELLLDLSVLTRTVHTLGRRLDQVMGVVLVTTERTITWQNGVCNCEANTPSILQCGISLISWAFNAAYDRVVTS